MQPGRNEAEQLLRAAEIWDVKARLREGRPWCSAEMWLLQGTDDTERPARVASEVVYGLICLC